MPIAHTELRKASLSGGFSLTELLVVVAVIGVLTAIGIPSYNGYISDSKLKVAQAGLRTIHTSQWEYRSDNGAFCTPSQCADTASINTVLFGGHQTLGSDSGYSFAVTSSDAGIAFTAQASNGSVTCQIDEKGNLSGC